MNPGMLLIGHHGCDRDVGEEVLAGRADLKPSNNDYDWLGQGVYFWQDDEQRAWDWAEKRHGKRACVIGAVIQPLSCLDMLQTEAFRLVRAAYDDLRHYHETSQLSLPENRPWKGELVIRRLDCAVIQFLHQTRQQNGAQPFDVIRAAFPEGSPLYPNAGFLDRSHIQLCVRDTHSILGYFRPNGLRKSKHLL